MKFSHHDNMSMARLLHIVVDEEAYRQSGIGMTMDGCIKHGVVFVNKNGTIEEAINARIALDVIHDLGLDNEIWGNSFHKTWQKVSNAPIEQLVLEQIMNYISTYGMESLGLDANPMIPCEKVVYNQDAIPNIKAFTVITVVDNGTAVSMVEEYIKGIKSPHKNEVNNIISLMEKTSVNPDDLMSFELKIARCSQLYTVPKDGQDFMRYVIYKMTGNTLVIKDKITIDKIKYFCTYHKNEAYNIVSKCNEAELSKVFYRLKPLILALKACPECRPIVNRVRRLAVRNHEPLSGMTASNIMNIIKEGKIADVEEILKRADNRTLVKLLNFSTSADSNIKVYNIRNGKTWVTERESNMEYINDLYDMCYAQLLENCKNKLAGKTYLIPEYVDYAVPVSEKQMIGNMPYGTVINATKSDMITPAIWWQDFNGRTDLDLHLSNAKEHLGWNGAYRSEAGTYSGDMTSADPYATEAYRLRVENDCVYLLNVNMYSGRDGCPFKLMFTDVDIRDRGRSPVNVEDAIFQPINLKFTDSWNISLGFIKGNSFVFYGSELGRRITPDLELNKKALDAVVSRCTEMFKLADFIEMCGGKVITSISDEMKSDVISLEPNVITASTIFEIVD